MVEFAGPLPTTARRVSWSRNVLRLPAIYDFDSEDEDNVLEAEKASEAVLPMSASFDSITREDANRLLKKENCNGMYLLRTSLNAESGKVLSVWNKGRCRHYRIYYDQDTQTYSLGSNGDNFNSISTVVAYYMFNDLPKSEFALTVPYGRSRQPIRIKRLLFPIKFTANRKRLSTSHQVHVR